MMVLATNFRTLHIGPATTVNGLGIVSAKPSRKFNTHDADPIDIAVSTESLAEV